MTQDTNDSIVYMDNYDFEPNNDWMNAYVLGMFRTTSRDGFVVEGSVHDMSDPADTFAFSRSMSRNFRFKLCAPAPWSCGETGQIDTMATTVSYNFYGHEND